jgi:hypothetical protein
MYFKRTPSLFRMSQRYSHRLKPNHVCHNRQRQTISAIPVCVKKDRIFRCLYVLSSTIGIIWQQALFYRHEIHQYIKFISSCDVLVADRRLQREVERYFADGNIIHYLSISPPPPPSEFYFVASEQLFFILSFWRRRRPRSSLRSRLHFYKKFMIPTTSPFAVRENLMIHIHSVCSVKVYLYVITLSSIYIYI